MEVCIREENDTDFLAREEYFETILETSAKIKWMKTAGNWIIAGNKLRECSGSEKRKLEE